MTYMLLADVIFNEVPEFIFEPAKTLENNKKELEHQIVLGLAWFQLASQ